VERHGQLTADFFGCAGDLWPHTEVDSVIRRVTVDCPRGPLRSFIASRPRFSKLYSGSPMPIRRCWTTGRGCLGMSRGTGHFAQIIFPRATINLPDDSAAVWLRTSFCVPVWQKEHVSVHPNLRADTKGAGGFFRGYTPPRPQDSRDAHTRIFAGAIPLTPCLSRTSATSITNFLGQLGAETLSTGWSWSAKSRGCPIDRSTGQICPTHAHLRLLSGVPSGINAARMRSRFQPDKVIGPSACYAEWS